MLKRFLAIAPALIVLAYGLWIGPKYDRFVLPAFDGHVYAAMAEDPRVFTLAPWGYRILAPWIVHLLRAPSAAVGFFWLNLACLGAALFLVGRWLRRLGFSENAAALAALCFAWSPPVRGLLQYQVLVDPLALLVLVAIFYELVDPDILVLMALFAAAALAKEMTLLSLSLVPIVLIRRSGWRRGILDSMVVAAPGLALFALLRSIWGNPAPADSFSVLEVTLGRLIQSGRALVMASAMSGLIVPALVGLIREKSFEIRAQGTVMWLLTFSVVVLNPYHYSVVDLPRLSVFAWPALLPLALAGLGFRRTPPSAPPRSPELRNAVSVVVLAMSLGLVMATDSYRRAPFAPVTNPVPLVGRIRGSLKTARALDAGERFVFDSQSDRFTAPILEPFNLTEGRRQRWFLYSGFGADAVFGSGAPSFRGEARVLLPILDPRDVTLKIEFEGPRGTNVALDVHGRNLGFVPANRGITILRLPSTVLFRGDNIVDLHGPAGTTIRLIRFEVRVARPTAPRS